MQKYFFLFISLLAAPILWSQSSNSVPVTLDSPNNTMYVHLYYLQKDSYDVEKAAQALAPLDLSKEVLKKRAVQLKQILDGQGLFVEFSRVPKDGNYIDTLTKKSLYTPFPKRMPGIFLEKEEGKWYYSAETVRGIPRLHKTVFPFGTDKLLNYLPKMGQTKILGLALWQYFGLLLLLVVGLLSHLVLSRILSLFFRRFNKKPDLIQRWEEFPIRKIARFVSVLIIIRLIKILLPVLLLPVTSMDYAVSIIRIISLVLVVLILLKIIDILMSVTHRLAQKTTTKMDEQLVPVLRRFLQTFVILGGILQLLSIFNVNLTALIAGVSIGGLAIALAAKDAVQNLIGSVMIFIDQPFQIGDFISDGNVTGTVEEVGFRSTRIRKPDSALVAVPNGSLANQSITNKGVRVFRLFQTNLGVVYQTTPDEIEAFVQGLKDLAKADPKVSDDGVYIHLNGLADSAITILFRVQLNVADYGEELAAKEVLLLSILRLAEKQGIGFAYPTTSVFLEKS